MSNGLFIQSYPAPGVAIVPASYTVGKGGYALIGTLTFLIIEIMGGPTRLVKSHWLPLDLFIYVVAVSLTLFFFRSFKLGVRPDGISYANFFRSERFIAFADISAVVLFTNWSSGRQSRLGSTTPGTIVITPKVETGKPVLKIPLWLFSNPAESQVTHLLRPEEWYTDS
jgi:hypothetical protein